MASPYVKHKGPYQTKLTPAEEEDFQKWAKANQVSISPDYDMRGFYKALKEGDPRAQSAVSEFDQELHFPDVWKTPAHESFSNESIYASGDAPYWHEGNQLINQHTGQQLADERLYSAEPANYSPGNIDAPQAPWLPPERIKEIMTKVKRK